MHRHPELIGRLMQRAFILPLLLIASLAFLAVGCSEKQEALSIGIVPLEQNALIYIADHEGFFNKHGLDISTRSYDTGAASIEALVKGEVAVAGAAEFPFVRAVFEGADVKIVACEDKFENDFLVARRDRGINGVSDLTGKRIGVSLHTITEFFLGRFLELHAIRMQDVSVVDVEPARFITAFAEGEVDALVAWEPYINRILRLEPERAFLWPVQSSRPVFGILAARGEWLATRRDTLKRFLSSLAKAEEFVLNHPDRAKTIVLERLKYDRSYMENVWPQHRFSLSLSETLIAAMKDQARWMIDNGLTSLEHIPDFAAHVHTESLRSVKPEAVNTIE